MNTKLQQLCLILVLSASVTACDNVNNPPAKERGQGKRSTKCFSCDEKKEQDILEAMRSDSVSSVMINEPAAIEFFNLAGAVMKYDGTDSLPEKLKHDGRQLLYHTIDQHGMYQEIIKPKLEAVPVKIIKGDLRDSLLSFDLNGKPFTINTSYFKENDGVIFYKPGRKPFLWTKKTTYKQCSVHEIVECYYSK